MIRRRSLLALPALIPATDTLPEAGETIRVSWDPARVHVMGSGA